MSMPNDAERPLAVIRCLAYNHAAYIRQTLEGFISQETTFPFVVIVHDDASTDSTAEIIREYAEKYPHIIKPILQTENQYSKHDGSLARAVNGATFATGAKYLALCEGDDYWTDPLKLQMQVDFLEAHTDYGMCYTKVTDYNQSLRKVTREWGGPAETFYELLKKNTVPTLSSLFLVSLYKEYLDTVCPSEKSWQMGDYPMWLYFALKSKIKFMDKVTGCYRVLTESACHTRSLQRQYSFKKSYFAIKDYFVDTFDIRPDDNQYEELQRIKYFDLLPSAVILNDRILIEEAGDFFKTHSKRKRDYMLLDFTPITRLLLKIKYRKKGFEF
ncbi:MAG: glycosyltransferase [Muribaculaceae bacterium]|nr:glycosyltransferase [Muribaculaceae bacterium]